MGTRDEKKFLKWLEQLEREAKRKQKKWLLQQQLQNTRNRPLNLSTSHRTNLFNRMSFSNQAFQTSSFSIFQSRQSRSPASDVVVKTNYCFAGHSKTKAGKRLGKAEVISKAQANLNYITRDGANQDLDENLSMLYNNKGQMLDNDEYSKFKSDLKEMDIAGFRRVVISPEDNLTREEMKELVTKSLRDYEHETGKDSEYVFSVHTNTDHTHAHVLMVSEHFNDLRWSQNDLQHFKEIVAENTRALINDRELIVDKTILQEFEKAHHQEQENNKTKDKTNEFHRSI